MRNIEIPFRIKADPLPEDFIKKYVDRAVANGDIRIELISGGELVLGQMPGASFTIDKTKYRLRLSDETEDRVKVWIEPK